MFACYPLLSQYLAGTTASGLFEARLGKEYFPGETHVFSPAYREDEFEQLLNYCLLYTSLQRYDAVDINVYEANLFHTKMMVKEIDLQNYLFNTDVYELPPKIRLEIMQNLRQEMIEIFSGRNIY